MSEMPPHTGFTNAIPPQVIETLLRMVHKPTPAAAEITSYAKSAFATIEPRPDHTGEIELEEERILAERNEIKRLEDQRRATDAIRAEATAESEFERSRAAALGLFVDFRREVTLGFH